MAVISIVVGGQSIQRQPVQQMGANHSIVNDVIQKAILR